MKRESLCVLRETSTNEPITWHNWSFLCLLHVSIGFYHLCVAMPLVIFPFCDLPFTFGNSWRRKWQPTPVFMPGKSHGPRSLVGYDPWGCKESHTTERLLLLEKEMTTHSSILPWRIPRTKEPRGRQSMWSQRVGCD